MLRCRRAFPSSTALMASVNSQAFLGQRSCRRAVPVSSCTGPRPAKASSRASTRPWRSARSLKMKSCSTQRQVPCILFHVFFSSFISSIFILSHVYRYDALERCSQPENIFMVCDVISTNSDIAFYWALFFWISSNAGFLLAIFPSLGFWNTWLQVVYKYWKALYRTAAFLCHSSSRRLNQGQ